MGGDEDRNGRIEDKIDALSVQVADLRVMTATVVERTDQLQKQFELSVNNRFETCPMRADLVKLSDRVTTTETKCGEFDEVDRKVVNLTTTVRALKMGWYFIIGAAGLAGTVVAILALTHVI
jgi:hypothetical protein